MTPVEHALPTYDFRSAHRRVVPAAPDVVWRALGALTLEDLRVTRPLVAVRHLGRTGPPGRSLLRDGPVRLLLDREGYAVGGAIARPWQLRPARREVADLAAFTAFDEPGWTRYLTEFRVEDHPEGSLLSTETRGDSTDDASRRWFAAYWALINVPSGIVRRDVLATVARAAVRRGGAPPARVPASASAPGGRRPPG